MFSKYFTTLLLLLIALMHNKFTTLNGHHGMATQSHTNQISSVETGTLNVVLGNQNCIVVASDSRRTFAGGSKYLDDSKKVFLVGKQRAISFAGFGGIEFPDLTDSIVVKLPSLIEKEISLNGQDIDDFDSYHWNNESPPPNLPDHIAAIWQPSYTWWASVTGSFCLIADILESYNKMVGIKLKLIRLQAGYKENGDVKIEKLIQVPVAITNQWGRKEYRMKQNIEYKISHSFIWQTAGIDELSRRILTNSLDSYIEIDSSSFPAIENYRNHFLNGTLHSMYENELVALAKDLIRITATNYIGVGDNPIQIAVIKKNKQSTITDDSLLTMVESAFATGMSGWVYTSDYPFDQLNNYNFVNCVIQNNTIPLTIDGNYFYGGEFTNVIFKYSGGEVYFGRNNTLVDCKINITNGCDERNLEPVKAHYKEQLTISYKD